MLKIIATYFVVDFENPVATSQGVHTNLQERHSRGLSEKVLRYFSSNVSSLLAWPHPPPYTSAQVQYETTLIIPLYHLGIVHSYNTP